VHNELDLFSEQSQREASSPTSLVQGMTYIPDFLTVAEQSAVLTEIDRQPWRHDLKRRVQHYGFRYDYKARRVDRSMYLGSLPQFAIPAASKLVERCLFRQLPDQLIVNEYVPGQGITAHIDCEPCFGEVIAMISLGWAYEMEFVHSVTRESRPILLEVGSALVITGDARYKWLHQIKARRTDHGVLRRRRVSLTFRNVVLSDQQL
jgi:alkylated DNA repair dioxygenase AlkB